MTVPTLGSLFTGIGGIDLAFAAAGFDVRWQVEIDEYCRKVLEKHSAQYWPNAARFADVRDLGLRDLERVDVIAGGFPCQDISWAGDGAGLAGERSGLWREFARLVGDLRPHVVFVENVPAITHRGGTTVVADLTALGYDARWGIVGAADAGAPHQRDRWWLVARDASRVRLEAGTDQSGVFGQASLADAARGPDRAEVADSHVGRRSKPQTQPDGEAHAQRYVSAYPAGRRTVFHAAVAGREDVEYAEGEPAASAPECDCRQRSARVSERIELRDRSFDTSVLGNTDRFGSTARTSFGTLSPINADRAGSEPERRSPQSDMGGDADGLSAGLDGHRWPAGPGPQHPWEPQRQIVSRGPNWKQRVKALGNAVVPQVVYPFAVEIAQLLREVTE